MDDLPDGVHAGVGPTGEDGARRWRVRQLAERHLQLLLHGLALVALPLAAVIAWTHILDRELIASDKLALSGLFLVLVEQDGLIDLHI